MYQIISSSPFCFQRYLQHPSVWWEVQATTWQIPSPSSSYLLLKLFLTSLYMKTAKDRPRFTRGWRKMPLDCPRDRIELHQPKYYDVPIPHITFLTVVLRHISSQWKWVFSFLLLSSISNGHGKYQDTQQEEALPTVERSFSTLATLLPRKTAAQFTGISYIRPDRWELHDLSSHDVYLFSFQLLHFPFSFPSNQGNLTWFSLMRLALAAAISLMSYWTSKFPPSCTLLLHIQREARRPRFS